VKYAAPRLRQRVKRIRARGTHLTMRPRRLFHQIVVPMR
jgi:hypothetical protein